MVYADLRSYYRSDAAVREYLAEERLKDAEPAILERMLAEGLERKSLLDVGVGGGRTTFHFAPRAGEYVGVDYSEPLVEAARVRFAGRGWRHVTFEAGDARDLSRFVDDRFDFALFSANGIDSISDLDGRMRALREIRRVVLPGGLFAFSSHNLQWVPTVIRPRRDLRSIKRALAMLVLNPRARSLARRGHALVADHRVSQFRWLRHFFVSPREQLRQLHEVGFTDAVALTREGQEVPEAELERLRNHWVYYLCRA